MVTNPSPPPPAAGGRIDTHFTHLNTQLGLLKTLTDLYKTLNSQFTTTLSSLNSKAQTLTQTLNSLSSSSESTLSSLSLRESSLSHRESYLRADIEAKRDTTLAELEGKGRGGGNGGDWVENLRGVCRRMDHEGLVRLLMAKRKESGALRNQLGNAINECVDPVRLVLDAVEGFVVDKKAAMGGWSSELTHRRWACGLVVSGVFPAEELKRRGEGGEGEGPLFARSVVERAWRLVEEWRGTLGENGDGLSGGAAEAAIFLHLMIGFGITDRFDEGFLKMLVMELAERKDYVRLYGPVFGDKMEGVIEELMNKNKEIEAVYFAASCGLTKKFPPVTLLNSYLRRSKTNATNILTSGKNSVAAVEESDNLELQSLRTVIKCVEENKIEHEYPRLKNLRIRLAKLEKDRSKKRSNPSGGGGSNKPFSKRSESSGGSRFRSLDLHSRPSKVPKYSDPYPTYDRRIPTPHAHQSPVPRYAGGPYNYPTPSAYAAPPAPMAYDSTYGGPHLLASASISQQHYQLPMDSVPASYEGQLAYTSYDYGAAASATAGYASYDYGAVAAVPSAHPSAYPQ
ncbi:FRIGIDA-like protein [Drosera capensis]